MQKPPSRALKTSQVTPRGQVKNHTAQRRAGQRYETRTECSKNPENGSAGAG